MMKSMMTCLFYFGMNAAVDFVGVVIVVPMRTVVAYLLASLHDCYY